MSPSDTAELNTGTVQPSVAETLAGAGLAAAETGTMDLAAGKGPIVAGLDAAEAAAQAASVPERLAALEAHIPVLGTVLGFLQSMFPHSTVAAVAMPAPAGDQAPTSPPPAAVWNGHQWVLPAEPSTPPPAAVWDAASKSWKLPA